MLTMYDEFAGVGGTSLGASKVPGLEVIAAANHNTDAIDAHRANFQNAQHFQEDITKMPLEKMPWAHIFGASPACPPWCDSRGKRRDFDKSNAQQTLFGQPAPADDATMRGRLLVTEVHRYLRGMIARHGRPVLGGVVENVMEFRLWSEWDTWLGEFHKLGYHTRVIAYNSMHADAPRSLRAPQSRPRLYVMYWHRSLGRHPDFDKWLRPTAYCPTCDRQVNAIQVFKKFGVDMGAYGEQYVYRCPSAMCRHAEVFPDVLPALEAIDLSIPGTPVGSRPATKNHPAGMAPATRDRIAAGIRLYWEPLLVSAGGGRDDGYRPDDGLPPFIIPFRGGGDLERARSIMEPVHTVTAGGNHHGIAFTPPALLVPYYGAAEEARPATRPVGTLTTRDRYGLATHPGGRPVVEVDDVLFRMLQPHEIGRAMGFDASYKVPARAKKTRVRLYGNAVTPTVAELLYSALVECISGESLRRERWELAA